MAGTEEGWDWFDDLYGTLIHEPVEGFVDYDMADQSRGRAEYQRAGGWGDPSYPRGHQKLRSDYANRLKMQRKLAEELRGPLAPYLPGGEFEQQ